MFSRSFETLKIKLGIWLYPTLSLVAGFTTGGIAIATGIAPFMVFVTSLSLVFGAACTVAVWHHEILAKVCTNAIGIGGLAALGLATLL